MIGLPCPDDMAYIEEQARIQRAIAEQEEKKDAIDRI